ncbi:hypothetical protein, partial [Gemmobacter lutimaris]|uniref:hypothetical protein n=1 Tax=Gemmobacter lutimaris TaxID=2306023 RepID=UPI001F1E96CB
SLSRTKRTARSRTSGENLFVVLLMMLHPTQKLEPPANPARFRLVDFYILECSRMSFATKCKTAFLGISLVLSGEAALAEACDYRPSHLIAGGGTYAAVRAH